MLFAISCQTGYYWDGTRCSKLIYNYFSCNISSLFILIIEGLLKSYTSACSAFYECNNAIGLVCPLTTTGSCNCPVNSSSIFCDCLRNYGNEYYWNGVSCQQARTFNQSCSNSTTNYMCQTLTQGTICSLVGSSYACQCPSFQYFDTALNNCTDQFSTYSTCTFDNMCQTVFGLYCISGVCK